MGLMLEFEGGGMVGGNWVETIDAPLAPMEFDMPSSTSFFSSRDLIDILIFI
jgi:hypothetical protein